MGAAKKVLLAVGIIFVAIQFIQPVKNKNGKTTATDISKVLTTPDAVRVILHNACYDCHSNNTSYPWYSYVQPVGWLLSNHITNGKNELNFSEFGNYPQRRQLSKLDEIADNVTDDVMPLKSYRMMHENARLGKNEKMLLIDWALHSKDSIPVKE